MIAQPSHVIKVVDKNGIRTVKTVLTGTQPQPAQAEPEAAMVS